MEDVHLPIVKSTDFFLPFPEYCAETQRVFHSLTFGKFATYIAKIL
jgi:hypothetical protein